MTPINIALCTYSYGIGDGIAHMDAALAHGMDASRFRLTLYVLRPDFPPGKVEKEDGTVHVALASAFGFLREEFAAMDIVQINGGFDPVACSAAAAAGVPAIVEVMHQVETGGLHPALDVVVCVSELVRSVQQRQALVIPNGVDTERFSFKTGRRERGRVVVGQVANACKALYCELGDVIGQLADPRVRAVSAGSRPTGPGVTNFGVRENMPAFFHGVDLLFLVERKSAFGLVFPEAMACGVLPIVSADSGAAQFVAKGGTGWIVDPKEPDAAVRVLERAVNVVETPRFITMQRQARELVERKYSLARTLASYEELYSALAGRPRREPAEPPAWMNLSLFSLLFFHKNPAAIQALADFIEDARPLEEAFLTHPLGQAAILAALGDCEALVKTGQGDFVTGLCRRLRASRCITPQLGAAEALVGALAGTGGQP